MPGRKIEIGVNYRYGFNGKENDNEAKGEGNQQDYGMRIYDPRLGRFLSVDQLTAQFAYYSPYQFAGNKPIGCIDLDGAEEKWKITTNFHLDYQPVFKAPNAGTAINNAVGNGLNFIWNNTLGAALGAGKGAWNWTVNQFTGNPQPPIDPVNSVNIWYEGLRDYYKETPTKQIWKDLGNTATDLNTYELPVQLLILHRLTGSSSITSTTLANQDKEAIANYLKNYSNQFKEIGSTKIIGEDYLKTFGGVSQKYFQTEVGKGGRFVDQFVNGVAYESKVGYATLTKDIKIQIAKDVEIMATYPEVKKMIWTFFESPVTGKAGASKPLQDALKAAGIETQIIR